MNESLFFLHICAILGLVYLASLMKEKGLLISFVLQVVMANLLVTKEILLFGFSVTCTDVFTIGSFITLTILQTRYGDQSAKEAIPLILYAFVFIAILSQIHLYYIPAPYDTAHPSYLTIFNHSPRIFLSSLAMTLITQYFYLFLLKKWKRPIPTLLLSQLIDTIAFTFLALYGVMHHLFDIILISYLIKVLAIITMTPVIRYAKRLQI
ncbi:MAG: queuosine precursor transporter [Simkaniaceae bacterium]|nr:queuosine precursor transporter [Simkaniaceae bacterium]